MGRVLTKIYVFFIPISSLNSFFHASIFSFSLTFISILWYVVFFSLSLRCFFVLSFICNHGELRPNVVVVSTPSQILTRTLFFLSVFSVFFFTAETLSFFLVFTEFFLPTVQCLGLLFYVFRHENSRL